MEQGTELMMFIVTILIACVTPQDKTEAEKIQKK
jgi:archaellum component FlaG (FlaF/FlaG flagellin family)